MIMNIQESAAGIYTCVATHSTSGATMNSTVNIFVQCERHDVYNNILYAQKMWRRIKNHVGIIYIRAMFLLCLKHIFMLLLATASFCYLYLLIVLYSLV